MKLVTNPEKAPGVDFLLRTANGPFVDTEVDVWVRLPGGAPKQERVYLSVAVVEQLAQAAGITKTISGISEEALIARGKLEGLREDLGDRALSLANDLRSIVRVAGLDGSTLDGAPDA